MGKALYDKCGLVKKRGRMCIDQCIVCRRTVDKGLHLHRERKKCVEKRLEKGYTWINYPHL